MERGARWVGLGWAAWIGAFAWLHGPTLQWLAEKLTRPSSHLNAALFVGCLALIVLRVHRVWGGRQALVAPIAIYTLGVGLAIAAGFSPALRHYGSLLGLALMAYASCGLGLSRAHWLRLLAPVALLLATLPVAEFLDIYLGFPLRRLQAGSVAQLI
ncbi:MAG: archaeosortase/exosortase family protein, partial [Myxococcota bacterium]